MLWNKRNRPKFISATSPLRHQNITRLSVEHLETRCLLSYLVVDLGSLGGGNTLAWSINNKTEIVGNSKTAGGLDHAYIWRNNVMTDLGTLGGAGSLAFAINNNSQITGKSSIAGDTEEHAFLWDNGNMIELPTLGGPDGAGTDINDAGKVVGQADLITPTYHAYVYTPNPPDIDDLGTLGTGDKSAARAINSQGQITGGSLTGEAEQRPFLWSEGVMTEIGTFGGSLTKAYSINDSTVIVGTSQLQVGSATTHAYRWKADQVPAMMDLGTLGGENSVARSINSAGIIIGDSQNAAGESRAFIYKNNTMIDLNTLIPRESGVFLEGGYGINDKGQIIAWGTRGGLQGRSFLLTRRALHDTLPPPGGGIPAPPVGPRILVAPFLAQPSQPTVVANNPTGDSSDETTAESDKTTAKSTRRHVSQRPPVDNLENQLVVSFSSQRV